ncbi:hypothetical protein AOLI_G00039770 [Acnodon oligacanthus]
MLGESSDPEATQRDWKLYREKTMQWKKRKREVKDMQRKAQQRLQEKEKKPQEVKRAVKTLKVSSEQRSAGAAASQLSQTLLQSDSEESSVGHYSSSLFKLCWSDGSGFSDGSLFI